MATFLEYALFEGMGVAPWIDIPGKRWSDGPGTIPDPDGQFGGGSIFDPDSLIQGFWLVSFEGNPLESPIATGTQLIPTYAADSIFMVPGVEGLVRNAPFVKSRLSSRGFVFIPGEILNDFQSLPVMMVVVNPPNEIKQGYKDSFDVVDSASPKGFDFVIKRPLTDYLLWPPRSDLRSPDYNTVVEVQPGSIATIGILDGGGMDGDVPNLLPGFFTTATKAEALALKERVDSGDFWLPLFYFITSGLDGTLLFEIEWPHSAGRG